MSTANTNNQAATDTTIYAELAGRLASSSTLCLVGDTSTIKAGNNLMLQACTCAALHTLVQTPAPALQKELSSADMYTVGTFIQPEINLVHDGVDTEIPLQNLTLHLLSFYASQRAFIQSQQRLQVIDTILQKSSDPSDPVTQDAQFYKTLQRQAGWYNLQQNLNTLNNLLCDIARVNIGWRHVATNLPNQATIQSSEIASTLGSAWHDNASYITAFKPDAFAIYDLQPLLHLIQQQPEQTHQMLLYDEQSYRYLVHHLEESQQVLTQLYK